MILTFKSKLTTAEFAGNLAQTFGKQNTKLSDKEIELGKTTYKGTRVDAKVAASNMVMEIYPTKSPAGWSKFVVIQDALKDDGKHSAEYGKVLATLRDSFAESK